VDIVKIELVKAQQTIDDCYSDYEHFAKYRSGIDETELKNSEATDKAVLTLSSASLALLLALAKDINLNNAELYSSYLYLGWFIILSAMSSVLASMFISGILHSNHRNKVDKILENRANIIETLQRRKSDEQLIEVDDKINFEPDNKLSKLTTTLHRLAPILLVIGIVFMGLFFQAHGIKGNENNERNREANTNTTTSSAAKTTSERREEVNMSEQRQNNSVPPPSPPPKAPSPRTSSNKN